MTISTGQAIAALAAMVGFVGSLLTIIRHLYEARLTDTRASCEQTTKGRDDVIADLRHRIERFEAREDESRRASDRVLSSMESQVEAQTKQAEVSRAMYERLMTEPQPARRSRSGD